MAVVKIKKEKSSSSFGYYDLTGPDDVVRFVQDRRVTVRNSFDFVDIEKTLSQISQPRYGSEINFQTASLSLDASSKIYGFRVDNLHNRLIHINNTFRPATGVKDEMVTPTETEHRKRPSRQKKPRSSYVETDFLRTTGAIEIDWDMLDRGEIFSKVNSKEGSMGRIMSFLPPADIHSVDITQENPWFVEGTLEDLCMPCRTLDIAEGLAISSSLENFTMDQPSGGLLSQESLNDPSQQEDNLDEYKFDPNTYQTQLEEASDDANGIETKFANPVIYRQIKTEDAPTTSTKSWFTIDGVSIRPTGNRGRPRRSPEPQFVPFLAETTQTPQDQPESHESPEERDFRTAVATSRRGRAIRLSDATFTKWAINAEKLKHADPLNVTLDSVAGRFCRLFFVASQIVPVQGYAEVDAATPGIDGRQIKTAPEEDEIDLAVASEAMDMGLEWPTGSQNSQEPVDYTQLLEAPEMAGAAKLYLARFTQQKRYNLKQIRNTMWESLNENSLFSELYDTIQPALSPSNRKALSPSLAFVALLSLANEQKLRLLETDGVDVRISRMTRSEQSLRDVMKESDSGSGSAKRSGSREGRTRKRARLSNDY